MDRLETVAGILPPPDPDPPVMMMMVVVMMIVTNPVLGTDITSSEPPGVHSVHRALL